MSVEPPISESEGPASKRKTPRTGTILGLFGLFILAVLVVLLRRAFPDRIPGRISKALRKPVGKHR